MLPEFLRHPPDRAAGRTIRSAVLLLLLCTPLRETSGGTATAAGPLRISAGTGNGWTLQYTSSSDPETIILGVPFDADVTTELTDPLYGVAEPQAGDESLTASAVRIEGPYTLRHQRIVALTVFPVRLDPVTGRPSRLLSAWIHVALHRMATEAGQPAPPDPGFEPVYRSLLANYEEARAWRRAATPVTTDPSRDWFETGREYQRVNVGADGWYRITPEQLGALSIDTSSLKLFANGAEIPITVRPDSTVEFYGRRNRGDSTFIDFYSDTSACWLTWGGSPGRRYSPASVLQGPAGPTVLSLHHTEHVEENTGYFTGTTQQEVIENGEVPGEGWYWERVFPGTVVNVPFTVAARDTANPLALLRVRLFSMTPDSPAADHHARFWINDSLAGEIFFEGRAEGVFTGSIPASWLRPGANELRVGSVPTPSIPNLFYLDWFEIGYARFLHAAGDVLEFTAEAAAGISEFRAGGFTGPSLEVRDLTLGRLITGVTVAPDSGGLYSATFRDTLGSSRRYLLTAGLARPVPPPRRHIFRDIRAGGGGADYVIITGSMFMTAARRLAAHRSARERLRTAVIDVQDIYDEFAYGVYDPTVIRTFLQYAFQHWPGPAPAHVLMLGDASWDHHRYLPTSVAHNAVPAYGVPAGDAWFVAPDSGVLPSMTIGRIPARDSLQALQTVEKLIAYDGQETGLWNKNFLMITGGSNPGEQTTFNTRSENTISTRLAPPPIGGTVFRAYKSSEGVIDGEHRERIRTLVRDGLVFVNFLGHSGGRVWSVDVGDPSTLENTDGKLPFVSSVSCNIAAFAEPSGPQLAEDFLLAPFRGALAAWASSSLGYPVSGSQLVNHFLSMVRDEPTRGLGSLTTAARIRLFLSDPGDPVGRAMLQLTPLIGDPLSQLAVPVLPDFVVEAGAISVESLVPPSDGGPLDATVELRNHGLVTAESVRIALTDLSDGRTTNVFEGSVRAPYHRDSLRIPWRAAPGLHTLTVVMDPADEVREADETNNRVSQDVVVSAGRVEVVKPLRSQVVRSGVVTLVCVGPSTGAGSAPLYTFELDTTLRFDSPFLLSSGPVAPGPIGAEWSTPPLPDGGVFFWRVRVEEGGHAGRWETGFFSTAIDSSPHPVVRILQHTPALFGTNVLEGVALGDSGITLAPRPARSILARSLGSRADPVTESFSLLRFGDLTMQGRWWEIGGGFMVLRVDGRTGSHEFRAFDVPGRPGEADSMTAYLGAARHGDYLALAVILDGRTNVTPALTASLAALGSTQLPILSPGMSWAFVCRKGFGEPLLEGASGDSVVLSSVIPAAYGPVPGALLGEPLAASACWDSLRWLPLVPAGGDIHFLLLGLRRDGGTDTIRTIGPDSTRVALSVSAPSGTYAALRPAFIFSTTDPGSTPLLTEWGADLRPPAELGLTIPVLMAGDTVVTRGTPFTFSVRVFNVGYATAFRVPVRIATFDWNNLPHSVAEAVIDSVAVGAPATAVFSLATEHLPPRVRVRAEIRPEGAGADLLEGNNVAFGAFGIAGTGGAPLRLLADGTHLLEGDYVSSHPEIRFGIPGGNDPPMTVRGALLLVDGAPVEPAGADPADPLFRPELTEGVHLLEGSVFRESGTFGDTLTRRATVRVESALRLVQVYTYPNPFQRETWFVFTATGSDRPEELAVRVFTVAGRKIREFSVSGAELQVGVNRVLWDGRDGDGEEIANGYYLYQLSARGTDGQSVAVTGKLARMR